MSLFRSFCHFFPSHFRSFCPFFPSLFLRRWTWQYFDVVLNDTPDCLRVAEASDGSCEFLLKGPGELILILIYQSRGMYITKASTMLTELLEQPGSYQIAVRFGHFSHHFVTFPHHFVTLSITFPSFCHFFPSFCHFFHHFFHHFVTFSIILSSDGGNV